MSGYTVTAIRTVDTYDTADTRIELVQYISYAALKRTDKCHLRPIRALIYVKKAFQVERCFVLYSCLHLNNSHYNKSSILTWGE
jgi:hypothetical protein